MTQELKAMCEEVFGTEAEELVKYIETPTEVTVREAGKHSREAFKRCLQPFLVTFPPGGIT